VLRERVGPSVMTEGPMIVRVLTAPDGNKVEVVTTDEEGLNHPGKYMTECKQWGKEI
jgi:hypothetical protein